MNRMMDLNRNKIKQNKIWQSIIQSRTLVNRGGSRTKDLLNIIKLTK